MFYTDDSGLLYHFFSEISKYHYTDGMIHNFQQLKTDLFSTAVNWNQLTLCTFTVFPIKQHIQPQVLSDQIELD